MSEEPTRIRASWHRVTETVHFEPNAISIWRRQGEMWIQHDRYIQWVVMLMMRELNVTVANIHDVQVRSPDRINGGSGFNVINVFANFNFNGAISQWIRRQFPWGNAFICGRQCSIECTAVPPQHLGRNSQRIEHSIVQNFQTQYEAEWPYMLNSFSLILQSGEPFNTDDDEIRQFVLNRFQEILQPAVRIIAVHVIAGRQRHHINVYFEPPKADDQQLFNFISRLNFINTPQLTMISTVFMHGRIFSIEPTYLVFNQGEYINRFERDERQLNEIRQLNQRFNNQTIRSMSPRRLSPYRR